ncbi:PqqD family protein [Streptomyces sp. NPDC052701]|uniref:PqqD family protein n=1 Tax=Streptomyces sp. NPDC052701 TaxID=3155533 RepID=UPI0034414972
MPIRPSPGVTAVVLENGDLELHSQESGVRTCWGPVNTAMWIALRQNDGHLEAAADLLAALWDVDPPCMRSDLEVWANELSDAGLLRNVP